MLPISDGVIWVGTTNGVARLSSVDTEKGSFESTARARWQVFNEDDGFPGVVVEDLLEDNDGRIWAATDNGVAVFDGQSWRAFTTADGLADDQVNDMALGSDGSIWFATERGASQYDGVTWHTFRRGDGLPATSVTSVFADREGAALTMFGQFEDATHWQDRAEVALKTHGDVALLGRLEVARAVTGCARTAKCGSCKPKDGCLCRCKICIGRSACVGKKSGDSGLVVVVLKDLSRLYGEMEEQTQAIQVDHEADKVMVEIGEGIRKRKIEDTVPLNALELLDNLLRLEHKQGLLPRLESWISDDG